MASDARAPTPPTVRVTLPESDLDSILLDKLRDEVFHVTSQQLYGRILQRGMVLVDPPEDARIWEYPSCLRSHGFVCLCDLRDLGEEQLQLGLSRYRFLDPHPSRWDHLAYLVLGPTAKNRITTYRTFAEKCGGKMLVPHIEAGYPGDLPVSAVGHVLLVQALREPLDPSSHIAAVRAHSQRHLRSE